MREAHSGIRRFFCLSSAPYWGRARGRISALCAFSFLLTPTTLIEYPLYAWTSWCTGVLSFEDGFRVN
ncbi:hypothetical protein BDW72DRAFT_181025 [Aspergillus terricola var. indicus]